MSRTVDHPNQALDAKHSPLGQDLAQPQRNWRVTVVVGWIESSVSEIGAFSIVLVGVGTVKNTVNVPCVIAAAVDILVSVGRVLSSIANAQSIGHDSRRIRSQQNVPSSYLPETAKKSL